MEQIKKFNPLTVSSVEEVIGKIIEWRAPAYSANFPYSGKAIIESVELNKHNPLSCKIIEGDELHFAFLDNHGLSTKDNGDTYQATETDFCFSLSDNYREVFYRVCE